MAEDKVITLGPNELPKLVSSYRLDGRNYLQWTQYICTTLKGRKKLSHIEGNDPPRDDPKLEAWDDDDSLIMTWLWNSDSGNKPKLYVLFLRTNPLRNRVLWDFKRVMDRVGPICKADSIAYTGLVERERIFKFLHSLNFEYDPIREKLPSLTKVFFIVRNEETRRSVMLDKGNFNIGSTMVTGKGPTKRSTFEEKPFTKSSRGEYCMYCKRSGHTKDIYYKRYGKEKVNQTTSNKENGVEHPSTSQLDQDIQAFRKEEMDRLRAFLNSTSKSLGSCGLIMNGKSSFNISGSGNISYALFPSHFTLYLKVPKRQLITVVNGDHVPIVGSSNIQLYSSLSLHNELTTGRTIGVAKEQGGLYYLQHTKIGNNTNKEELPSSQRTTSETWAASQI
ncbi:hypothetical protein CR513_22234, partial [Mucuna pruriens]